MEMAIWRGHIENLGTPGPKGTAECRLGQASVQLPPDLTGSVADGDKVLVAGASTNGVLAAMAVHNLTRGKLTQVDPTNQVLIAGLWGFIGLMSLAVGWQFPMGAPFVILNVIALIGAAGVLRCVNVIFRVASAASWIRYPDLQ